MVENNNKKTKCLVLKEDLDIKSYGVSNGALYLRLVDSDGFDKCRDFFYIKDFIFHYYANDFLDRAEFAGVYRYEKCEIISFSEHENSVTIKVNNKKFYNISEIKLLRKDKIGSLLNNFDDGE